MSEAGIEMPICLPDDHHTILHTLASWIWAQGGDFCSKDGKHVLFDRPESLAAIRAYFGLLSYLSPDALTKASQQKSVDLFYNGHTAIHFHDLPVMAPEQKMAPDVLGNWGTTPLPKPYFVGGTNLVIWQHSPHVHAAVNLVKFLTSVPTLRQVMGPFRLLAPRVEAMAMPKFLDKALLKDLGDIASDGRSYPAVKLWGVIEERLIATLFEIRSAILADPQINLDELIQQKITLLAHKLNITLSQ
jgi:ABC-type glycerol-3-phosphate transport system substrate-binding protein